MTPSQSSCEAEQTRWLAAIAAALGLWMIPVAARLCAFSDDEAGGVFLVGLVGVLVALAVCASFRAARWVVVVWVPLLGWAILGVLLTVGELGAESGGGASAAPLAGVASAMALAVVGVFVGVILLALKFRPREFFTPLVLLAIVNTAFVSYATRASYRQSTGQEILVQFLDPRGAPISGAAVSFTRYGYGPHGTNVYDGKGGPIVSGADGLVKIPSRRMRYETRGMISRTGYRSMSFTLGMQYSKWDDARDLKISTDSTENIAWMAVPATDPVNFSVYLSPLSDSPPGTKIREIGTDIGTDTQAKHVLDLATGQFSSGSEGDIRFDLFFEKENGQYERPRLRITGINGAKVLQVPPTFELKNGRPSYENLFRIAPVEGYQGDTVIQRPSDSPGPTIYVAARDGKLYARLTVDAWGKSGEPHVSCRVKLFVNPTGSRLLE